MGSWIKIQCAGNELSKFRVHITWNYTKARLRAALAKNCIALSASLPGDSPCWAGTRSVLGKSIEPQRISSERNNSFVNDITSLPIFAYLAAVNMLASIHHSRSDCMHTHICKGGVNTSSSDYWQLSKKHTLACRVWLDDSRVTVLKGSRLPGMKRWLNTKWQERRRFKVIWETSLYTGPAEADPSPAPDTDALFQLLSQKLKVRTRLGVKEKKENGEWCFLLCLLPRSCDRKQERVVKVGQCTEQQIAADRQILDTIASYFLLDLTALYSVPGESIRTMVCLVFSTPIDLAVICLLHSQALDNKKHTHTQ